MPNNYLRRLIALVQLATVTLLLTACATTAPTETPAFDAAQLLGETAVAEATATIAPATSPPETAVPAVEPTMTIAPPTSTPTITPTPYIYVVQQNDALEAIAARFGVSVEAIQQANGLTDANVILVDQALIIPAVGQSLPAPTDAPAAISEGSQPRESETVVNGTRLDGAESPTPKATPTSGRALIASNGKLCPAEQPAIPAGAEVVGRSAVCGLPILSYRLGDGEIPVVLVSGIHGGYEWNTIQLGYEMLDYLHGYPNTIPAELSVYIIPNANPDGLYAVSGQTGRFSAADLDEDTRPGRFNGNNIDLNRNWDCEHSPNAVWGETPISGGAFPFSEAENVALRDYIMGLQPAATLFWHSAATGVYASGCGAVDPASKELAVLYGQASGYPVYDTFGHYDVTGDAGDWLAAQGVPSLSVELTDHTYMNWDMNLAGVRALFGHVVRRNDPTAAGGIAE